jgi:hypothetical protein
LHPSIADLEWTVNAFVLSFAVLLMTGPCWVTATAGGGCSLPGSACSRRRPQRVRWRVASACWSPRAAQGAGAALMIQRCRRQPPIRVAGAGLVVCLPGSAGGHGRDS